MGWSSLDRCALSTSAALALLAGCGAPSEIAVPPAAMAVPSASASHDLERSDSWMLPDAKTETLLYVSASPSDVFVYAYPRPKFVGQLRFNAEVAGVCADNAGNVWVTLFDRTTGTGKILRYKHGERRRTGALADPGFPSGCAADPLTGNLAVSNYCVEYHGSTCVNNGDVVVYSHATGNGVAYQDAAMNAYGFCTYDNSGDLFVAGNGYASPFRLAELPKQATQFKELSVDASLSMPAGLQWHGKHLAIAYGKTIYSFAIGRAKTIELGETQLNDTVGAVQFALQGETAIVPGTATTNIAFYRYPKGGTPGKTILFFNAISAALSPYRPAK